MIKPLLGTLFLSGFLIVESFGQKYMFIRMKDGTTEKIPIQNIEKLVFKDLVLATKEQRAMAAQSLSNWSSYPNPASTHFDLRYELKASSPVVMELYSEKGELVAKVDKGVEAKGSHEYRWATANYPNGLYICKIITAEGIVPRKVVIHN